MGRGEEGRGGEGRGGEGRGENSNGEVDALGFQTYVHMFQNCPSIYFMAGCIRRPTHS